MTDFIPPQPAHSFRITLDLLCACDRLDTVLLPALKKQIEQPRLKEISRSKFKDLFNDGKIFIKGQRAKPKSSVAKGITYVDILGF